MILTERNGNKCNLDKIYGIEISLGGFFWFPWNRYKDIRSVLYALEDLKKYYNNIRGEKDYFFRIIHLNYDLDVISLRKLKIMNILNV